ncbi:hypothetical protein KM043_012053 [Ampulex compressa]|nr:hypothetical protein KM043_012053 [Ampulex compressa]
MLMDCVTILQTGALSIVVPPDFIAKETSSDATISEGGQVKLTCRARGVPPPRVSWRREDGKDIIIREPFAGTALSQKFHVTSVAEFQGEELNLTKISRNEMGVYLCIASNGIPPAVSKRILINVYFAPVIRVPNQLVGAPLGTDVALECYVEAFPKSINYWVKEDGGMIIASVRDDVKTIAKSQFEVQMILAIRSLQKSDMGAYRCMAKNSLGEVESNIRLYEIPGPASRSSFDDEEDEGTYGSAEMDKTENRPYFVDNTVHGHVGYPSVATPAPTVRIEAALSPAWDPKGPHGRPGALPLGQLGAQGASSSLSGLFVNGSPNPEIRASLDLFTAVTPRDTGDTAAR